MRKLTGVSALLLVLALNALWEQQRKPRRIAAKRQRHDAERDGAPDYKVEGGRA